MNGFPYFISDGDGETLDDALHGYPRSILEGLLAEGLEDSLEDVACALEDMGVDPEDLEDMF
jgi:hypothetical protein